MDFEWSWLLLGLPLAFVLGWLASRLDWRQMRVLQRHSPRTYFQGLTYLLNEQQDKAIDVFVEAVQDDPDTVELHFALGSLFRRRGEYDRAVRVHQHLLARADLSGDDQARAQWDLAQDFLKAGLLDRAEQALQQLESSKLSRQSHLALLAIYERTHDWDQAQALAARMMDDEAPGQMLGRQVHYACEQAAQAIQQQDFGQATRLLQQAMTQQSSSVRPHIEWVKLLLVQGQQELALQAILALAQSAPDTVPLLAGLVTAQLPNMPATSAELEPLHAMLRAHYEKQPSLDVLLGLVALEQRLDIPRAWRWYVEHIRNYPSLVAAARLVQAQPEHADLQRSLDQAMQPLMRYRCVQCGFETRQYFWQCPGCQSWESFPPKRIEELQ